MSADDTTDDGQERATGDEADEETPADEDNDRAPVDEADEGAPGDTVDDQSPADHPDTEETADSSDKQVTDDALGGATSGQSEPAEGDAREELAERLNDGTDRAVEEFDQRIVDLLSWLLDTETRARIYVYLQQNPNSTSEEITEGTGLYPSTVREALAELTEEDTVERQKRDTDGAGNNPYEYTAIPPSDLVGSVAGQIQHELNTVFNLGDHLGSESTDNDAEPVTITVEDIDASDPREETMDDESDEDDESANEQ